MSYTKVLGKCCNSDCSKKSSVPAVPTPPASVVMPDTQGNRLRDRAQALLTAPQGITRTDLDMGEFFFLNQVPWLPDVFNPDPVQDFTKYCFACKTQHQRSVRDLCMGRNCQRYMFIDCGHYGGIEGLDLNIEETVPTYFRCCDCKKLHETSVEFYQVLESLPPRSSNSRFSGNTF